VDEALDLTRFLSAYSVDVQLGAPRAEPTTSREVSGTASDSLDRVLEQIGGMSFCNGLYRVHTPADVPAWNATIATAWKETAGRVRVFAYDWLGRQFALYGDRMILQFSAGDLEFNEIPVDLVGLHNEELVTYRQEALAYAFHEAWLKSGGAPPRYSQCIGYQRPLFLGGVDEVENLEAIDLDVYWTISAPLIAKARQVGVGGVIGQIEIGE
jgi:hypothetical protein